MEYSNKRLEKYILDSFKEADLVSTGPIVDTEIVYGKDRQYTIDAFKLIKSCSGYGLLPRLVKIDDHLIYHRLGKIQIFKIIDQATFKGKEYQGLRKHIKSIKNARDRGLVNKTKTK
jgi:hypothetical protein